MPALSRTGAPPAPPLRAVAIADAIKLLWDPAAGHRHPGARPPRRRVFPGRPDQVARAREFVSRALAGSPGAADAALLTSELATNAILHTRSGTGGRFEVVVWHGPRAACIAVADEGTPAGDRATAGERDGCELRESPAPDLGPDECGHGLAIVAALSTCWGACPHPLRPGQVVWFLLSSDRQE